MRKFIKASDAGVKITKKVDGITYKFVAQFTTKTSAWEECYSTRRGGCKATITKTVGGYNLYRA